MRSNRGTETNLEVRLRNALWASGIRGYRKNVTKLPGRPDVLFGSKRLAVFIHGCYWHRCPRCNKDAKFHTNEAFWRSKLQSNVERDQRNEEALTQLGYRVLVIWECEVKRDLAGCVDQVRDALIQPTV